MMMQTPGLQAGRSDRGGRGRWRWYYFYFVLAGIDVAVILAGVFVHHSTLASFDAALADVTEAHRRQRWLSDVQTAVIRLNAPGNDVFESGDVAAAESAFAQAHDDWDALITQRPEDATDLAEFVGLVSSMATEARLIFQRHRQLATEEPESGRARAILANATASMALMDRAQAAALALLNEASSHLRGQQRAGLDFHRASLDRRTRIEIAFVLVVVLILAGVFWYGRKLHDTHERLLAGARRLEEERQRRLASVGAVCFQCAHGIRNPLASIRTSAQLLLEYGNLDDLAQRRAEDIIATSGVLGERISRLLGHARVDALAIETVRAPAVLDQAVAEVKDRLDACGIAVERDFACRNVPFEADRALLVQAIIELIGNVMDHGQGASITLRSRRSATGRIELGIADEGPGIPPEIKDHVLDLFFTSKPEGHGIGLASVQRTADRLGGEVVVADEQPHGTYVGLILPLSHSDSARR